MDKSIKNINIIVEAEAMSKPLAADANVIANTTSDADKGLWITSVIVPIIFPIIKDELEWAKLCWITCIIIKPLAKNLIYGTPNTSALWSPIAKEITVKNNILVNIGPNKVWPETVRNLKTSFLNNE